MLAPDGRVVMISGANRGIGLATAKHLAQVGYLLSLGGRDPHALAAATSGLPADRVLRCAWEASDNATSKAWVAQTVERFGRIDAVFANAGIALAANIEDEDETPYDAMWEVNFKGPLRMIRAALPMLRASGSGRVITLASLSGKRVPSESLGYPASKFAAVALTHAVRHAGWADGIRATALCPGMVDTDMVADKAVAEGAFKIEPETIAASVAYLLSLPNHASVAELLVNGRFEASI
ncbi:MAG TPA: SDR family NAD(P)-dependent oxidoreductase [Thermohalobaculum sp.]|nr:SDR family NAD(P)-dependent oxidoreductase [Thermohalobaculum sp.]